MLRWPWSCCVWHAGLTGSAAEPPAAAIKPRPRAGAGNSACGHIDGPGAGIADRCIRRVRERPATVPDRIDPTEKVHSDSEISFPVDI